MTRANRITSVFILAGLLISSLAGIARSQGPTVDRKTFTISGSTGLPGVTLQGFPGLVMTDGNGVYSVEIPRNWTGAVVPVKAGYAFQPPRREYTAVDGNRTGDNYRTAIITFTIFGSTGVPGVVMQGLPSNVVTDATGRYKVTVPYGWSGTVAPKKPGFEFTPGSREYPAVREDCPNQDYLPRVLSFTISGNVGVEGATLKGLPGNPVTDSQGRYEAQVGYGWSGRVMPIREGYAFTPEYQTYSSVDKDLPNQNYKAAARTFTISGRVWTHAAGVSGTLGVPGVILVGFPGEPLTDEEGRYIATVEYGWSGVVVPRKEGCNFEPASREYAQVTANQREQNFIGEIGMLPDYAGDVLVIPTTGVMPEQFVQIAEDLRVMLHIFREKLSEPRMILGVLRDYGNFFGSDRKVEALYLQGTAAVFVIEVDFPYSFPSQPTQESDATEDETVDPVWQRARERLYAPPGSRGYGTRGQAGQTQEMTFEQFKEELLRSLKHAANLRNLDPNELVILTIVAQNEEAGWLGQTSYTRSRTPYGVSAVSSSRLTSRPSTAPTLNEQANPRLNPLGRPMMQGAVPPSTVLTMQARKADIDAFAKGDLDLERFQQKVRTFTY